MSLLNVFEQRQGNNTDAAFKKVVVLESTIGLLEQKACGIPECLLEALVTFEIYNSCLTDAGLPQQCNSSHVLWK